MKIIKENANNLNVFRTGIVNLFSLFKSQFFSVSVSVILTFFLPVFIGIEQYGFWQVYLLYVTFAMLLGLGFTDGIYLIYGNFNYRDLPFEKLRSSLRVYIILAIILTVLAVLFSLNENNIQKKYALIGASLNIFLLLVINAAYSVLQFTNRIREYSSIVIFGKTLLIIGLILIAVLKNMNFKTIIAFDLFVKFILLVIIVFLLKDIFFGKISSIKVAFYEWFISVRTGVMIMLSVYASSLILNIGKILIERFEDIKIYSSYALAVSFSSFFLVFVAAFSLSIYPMLKRLNESKLPGLYEKINSVLFFISFTLLGIFYPFNFIINKWFEEYYLVIEVLPLFLIITLIQGKEQLLNVTYMKTFRKEKKLLLINLIFSIITCTILIPIFLYTHSIFVTALITCLIVCAKCYYIEYFIRGKILKLKFHNLWYELLLLLLFVLNSIFLNLNIGFSVFISVVILFFLVKSSSLIIFIKQVLTVLRK